MSDPTGNVGQRFQTTGAILTTLCMHRDVITVGPDEAVADAAHTLLDNKWGCLPVVNDEGDLLGIVTEADFLRLTVRLLA